MATMEEQRDACLEATIYEAQKVLVLRKQRDNLLKMLEDAVAMTELPAAARVAGNADCCMNEDWLKSAKSLIASTKVTA